jgi:hypothetical protein
LELIESTKEVFKVRGTYINNEQVLKEGVFSISAKATSLNSHFSIESSEPFAKIYISPEKIFNKNKFCLTNQESPVQKTWKPFEGNLKEELDFLDDIDQDYLEEIESFTYQIELPFFDNATLIAIKDPSASWKYPTKINGTLNLNGINIGGDIILSNVHVLEKLNLSQSKVQSNIIAKPLRIKSNLISGRTTSSYVNLESIEVTHNIDISGVSMLKRDAYLGGVNAKNSKVKESFKLVDKIKDQDLAPSSLTLEGDLDLSGAEINSIVLSGNSFPKAPEQTLRLERVNIRYFDWRGSFPQGLETKLRDFKVGTWSKEGINVLENILAAESSNEFKRSTYIEIEKTLKNQGYENQAERVYKLMWNKIKNKERLNKRRFKSTNFFHWFRSWFGYGIKQAKWCFRIFLLFLIMSFFIFHNPNNVISSALTLAANQTEETPPGDSPNEEEWGVGGTIWFTLRYNIPIVPFDAHKQFRPNIHELHFLGWKTTKISAQDYAEFIEFTHWIIWSVFLLYLSGIIRRVERT